jgi:aldose 1-epimerase
MVGDRLTSVEPVLPTGRQHEISRGEHTAVVVEVGGGLRSYDVGDRRVLDGYAVQHPADGARGQMLLPWPNRVRDGRWEWNGTSQQLALSEPARHNAMHGLVRWLPWELVESAGDAVTLGCRLYPQPGYPWALTANNTYRLTGHGLQVSTTVRNMSSTDAPVAWGFHPYVAAAGLVDECTMQFNASTYLVTDDQQIPVERRSVDGTSFDFRQPRSVGELELDVAFTDLARDTDGRFWLTFTDPSEGPVRFWTDASYRYVQLFSGDDLPDAQRRRRGLAVEPMTAPANALATGDSLLVLAPGAAANAQWGLDIG